MGMSACYTSTCQGKPCATHCEPITSVPSLELLKHLPLAAIPEEEEETIIPVTRKRPTKRMNAKAIIVLRQLRGRYRVKAVAK